MSAARRVRPGNGNYGRFRAIRARASRYLEKLVPARQDARESLPRITSGVTPERPGTRLVTAGTITIAMAVQDEPVLVSRHPVASPRILVADDQPDILQALRLLLADAGFETDLVTRLTTSLRASAASRTTCS